MKKIKYYHDGIIHRIVQCNQCNFCLYYGGEGYDELNKIMYNSKKHCKDTGHTLTVETGTVGRIK